MQTATCKPNRCPLSRPTASALSLTLTRSARLLCCVQTRGRRIIRGLQASWRGGVPRACQGSDLGAAWGATMPKQAKNYYAVRKGRTTGVFQTWPECQEQVHGYGGAQFKGFATLTDAQAYLGSVANNASSAAGAAGRTTTTTTHRAGNAAARYHPYAAACTCSMCVQTGAANPVQARTGLMVAPPPSERPQEPPTTSNTRFFPPTTKPEPQEVVNTCCAHGWAVVIQPGVTISKTPGAYKMNFDGASRGNPGKAGAGAYIAERATGRKVAGLACPLPYGCTNNEAEYGGIILGLQACATLGMVAPLVLGDSKLICNQVLGVWRVKEPHLQPYHKAAVELLQALTPGGTKPQVQHVYREANQEADKLSNDAVDMQG